MRLLTTSLLFLTILSNYVISAESNGKSKSSKPCTLHSPTSGSYFDLTQLQLYPPKDPKKAIAPSQPTESWHVRGHDYGANFTINFCGPVIEQLKDVEGVDKKLWQNVSAYYKTEKENIYSIGQANSEPLFRGRKLVLNYTDGSPCPDFEDVETSPKAEHRKRKSKHDDDEDEDEDEEDNDDDNKSSKKKSSKRRKSTIMSFLCDTSPSVTSHPQISFIGTPDSCSYFFEVRSRYACGGASSSDQSSLGPGGVFAVILAIAIVAYLIGGCAYQRTVMHQRGWRQCPNYGVWQGIFSFLGVSGLFASKKRGNIEWDLPSDRFD